MGKPISYYPCRFCGAKAHQLCRPKDYPRDPWDRRHYPMGHFHALRCADAELARALGIDGSVVNREADGNAS